MYQLLPFGDRVCILYLILLLILLIILLFKLNDRKKKERTKQKIIDYLNVGDKMEAIKTYKDFYACSLSKAKTAISEIEFELEYQKRKNDHADSQQQINTNVGFQLISSVSDIDGMEGHQFEYYCAELLRKNGFSNVSVTPGSGDQGVDILAAKEGIKYAIQCKNYSSPLSNTPIQEVNAGKTFYNCHVGVVMTNSTFTDGAISLAKATGVLLWGRDTLQKMINDEKQ